MTRCPACGRRVAGACPVHGKVELPEPDSSQISGPTSPTFAGYRILRLVAHGRVRLRLRGRARGRRRDGGHQAAASGSTGRAALPLARGGGARRGGGASRAGAARPRGAGGRDALPGDGVPDDPDARRAAARARRADAAGPGVRAGAPGPRRAGGGARQGLRPPRSQAGEHLRRRGPAARHAGRLRAGGRPGDARAARATPPSPGPAWARPSTCRRSSARGAPTSTPAPTSTRWASSCSRSARATLPSGDRAPWCARATSAAGPRGSRRWSRGGSSRARSTRWSPAASPRIGAIATPPSPSSARRSPPSSTRRPRRAR